MDDLTFYRNFRIYNTGNSFIVRADSKRFGKSEAAFLMGGYYEFVINIYSLCNDIIANASGKLLFMDKSRDS